MLRNRIKIAIGVCLIFGTTLFAQYQPSHLDTKKAPLPMSYAITKPENFETLYETENFIYYFKEDRDVLAIFDKRNGYTWKTGLDIAFASEVRDGLREGDPIGFEPIEERMNTTFTGIANALVVVEYYDSSMGIKRLASSAQEGAASVLKSVDGTDNHFILDITYDEIDLTLNAHIYLEAQGYSIEILYDEIQGADKHRMASIMLNPFLGASGGMHRLYDADTGSHGDPVPKDKIPGYVLVPDGPGALMRFTDYHTSIKRYQAAIYGNNLAKGTYHEHNVSSQFIPFKNPVMPVYGIAHGDRQAAFIGYATSGDTFMELIVMPEENTTMYTWAYPRFVYNTPYYQVFNKAGEGYFTLPETQNMFDIRFEYHFLAGDGADGYPADYVGMAKAYQEVLVDRGILTKIPEALPPVTMQVDIIMSDLKKAVIGHEHVIMTTAQQVQTILEAIEQTGVDHMQVALYGWQKNGMTGGKPWQTNWHRPIGSKSAFEDLIAYGAENEIGISFAQDYLNIHSDQMTLTGNALKHINGWYLQRHIQEQVPFDHFYYAGPEQSAKWLVDQVDRLLDLDIKGHTVTGISQTLLSDHARTPILEAEVATLYQEALSSVGEKVALNLVTPNQYLWPMTDAFLQAPMFPTQFLIETDTVPFLQMVLHGTMPVYGPYSNFSFSEPKDVLRMIDYNTYPAFVLTYEPAHLLASTNAMDFYATGYDQFEALMGRVYGTVHDALSQVSGLAWIDREVLGNGLIKNTYEQGYVIYINYTQMEKEVEGHRILPLNVLVVQEGGQ